MVIGKKAWCEIAVPFHPEKCSPGLRSASCVGYSCLPITTLTNHGLDFIPWGIVMLEELWFRPLGPVKRNHNAGAYKDILNNCMLVIVALQHQRGKDHHMGEMDGSPNTFGYIVYVSLQPLIVGGNSLIDFFPGRSALREGDLGQLPVGSRPQVSVALLHCTLLKSTNVFF